MSETKDETIFDSVERFEVHPLAVSVLLGKSGLRVSKIVLGTMTFGERWGFTGAVTKADCEQIFNAYCDKGGNFIDTACNYQGGQSEEWLGEFIEKRGNREELVIATKFSFPTKRGAVNMAGNHRKNMFQSLHRSLQRLRTTAVDILYLHLLDYTTPAEEIMRGLNDLVQQGSVYYLGVSDTPAWFVARCNTIAELRGWAPFVCYQGKYHLGERDVEREIAPMCKALGLSVVPWNVLGTGKWTGKYQKQSSASLPTASSSSSSSASSSTDKGREGVYLNDKDWKIIDTLNAIAIETSLTHAQIALKWAISKGVLPIVGVRKVSQLEDNLKALESEPLTASQMERLDNVSSIEADFPTSFLGGTDYTTSNWIKPAGIIE